MRPIAGQCGVFLIVMAIIISSYKLDGFEWHSVMRTELYGPFPFLLSFSPLDTKFESFLLGRAIQGNIQFSG
jgi:hypothetical protein